MPYKTWCGAFAGLLIQEFGGMGQEDPRDQAVELSSINYGMLDAANTYMHRVSIRLECF